jgi:hypothetical protein
MKFTELAWHVAGVAVMTTLALTPTFTHAESKVAISAPVTVTNTVPVTGTVSVSGVSDVRLTNKIVPIFGTVGVDGTVNVNVANDPANPLPVKAQGAVSFVIPFSTRNRTLGPVDSYQYRFILPGPSILESAAAFCEGGAAIAHLVIWADVQGRGGPDVALPSGITTYSYNAIGDPTGASTGVLQGSKYYLPASNNVVQLTSLSVPVSTIDIRGWDRVNVGSGAYCEGSLVLHSLN